MRYYTSKLIRYNLTASLGKRWSSWYKKRPPTSQFVADIEGEPYKTTVTVLNQPDSYLFIDSFSALGFKLNNGVAIMGPCAVFPKTCLHWNIAGPEEINMESLTLFRVLEPKLDLLVVGIGEADELQYVNKDLYKDLKLLGIGLELLPTHQACATFNFLNDEKRCVAAALLPPKRVSRRDMSEFLLPDNPDTIGLSTRLPNPDFNPDTGRVETENYPPDDDDKKRLT